MTHYWDVTFLTQIVPSCYSAVTYMELFFLHKVSKYHFQPLISVYVSERECVACMILFCYPYKEVSQKYHGSVIGPCSHCIPFQCFHYMNVLGTFWAVFVPTWGNVLAPHGHAACPTWARCLPRMGRFAVRQVPNKLML